MTKPPIIQDESFTQFSSDVFSGLAKTKKSLPSRYLYNEKGNQLFQAIMGMTEYYPTRSEYEILENHAADILHPFLGYGGFNLVEFGAGDGKKTKLLLEYLYQKRVEFAYVPIDISGHILDELHHELAIQFPALTVNPLELDYFSALDELNRYSKQPKLILFLGSNIGNFESDESLRFLKSLYERMNPGDHLLLGADIHHDPRQVLEAYNDRAGITRDFNLNLLDRLNEELHADFVIDQFYHYATFDPQTGTAKSFLVSKIDQEVSFEEAGCSIPFYSGESILTEISQKYSPESLDDWARKIGFEVVDRFTDRRHRFLDALWKKA